MAPRGAIFYLTVALTIANQHPMRTPPAKSKNSRRKASARSSRVPRESVRRDYGQEGTESNIKRNTTGQGRRKDRD
jgi:hypothetical protein